MVKKQFLRRQWTRFSRLGRRKKSKQKWRRPTGRHNKMREKQKGYPVVVSIGYKKKVSERNNFDGKKKVIVYNVHDLEKIGKDEIGFIAKVGKKNKIEIIKKAIEMKKPILNVNEKKLLRKVERQKIKKKEEVKSTDKNEKIKENKVEGDKK